MSPIGLAVNAPAGIVEIAGGTSQDKDLAFRNLSVSSDCPCFKEQYV